MNMFYISPRWALCVGELLHPRGTPRSSPRTFLPLPPFELHPPHNLSRSIFRVNLSENINYCRTDGRRRESCEFRFRLRIDCGMINVRIRISVVGDISSLLRVAAVLIAIALFGCVLTVLLWFVVYHWVLFVFCASVLFVRSVLEMFKQKL